VSDFRDVGIANANWVYLKSKFPSCEYVFITYTIYVLIGEISIQNIMEYIFHIVWILVSYVYVCPFNIFSILTS